MCLSWTHLIILSLSGVVSVCRENVHVFAWCVCCECLLCMLPAHVSSCLARNWLLCLFGLVCVCPVFLCLSVPVCAYVFLECNVCASFFSRFFFVSDFLSLCGRSTALHHNLTTNRRLTRAQSSTQSTTTHAGAGALVFSSFFLDASITWVCPGQYPQ